MPAGSQQIVVTVDGVASDPLPFSVRTSGNIYFVDHNNATSGTGSFANPWKTIISAVGAMVANDITYVRAGTYTEEGTCNCAVLPLGTSDGGASEDRIYRLSGRASDHLDRR